MSKESSFGGLLLLFTVSSLSLSLSYILSFPLFISHPHFLLSLSLSMSLSYYLFLSLCLSMSLSYSLYVSLTLSPLSHSFFPSLCLYLSLLMSLSLCFSFSLIFYPPPPLSLLFFYLSHTHSLSLSFSLFFLSVIMDCLWESSQMILIRLQWHKRYLVFLAYFLSLSIMTFNRRSRSLVFKGFFLLENQEEIIEKILTYTELLLNFLMLHQFNFKICNITMK